MKRHYKFTLAHLFLLLFYHQNFSYAGYELTAPGDPQRRWSASVATTLEYDDNIFTREINEQGSFKTIVSPRMTLRIPFNRTFAAVRYEYRATYFENRSSDPVDQTHLVNLYISHNFSPKLHLDIRDIIRQGIEPELVELVDNVPIVERRRGDFIYNKFSWKLSYDLTTRWAVSLNNHLEFWNFDEPATATGNDRTTFHLGLSTDFEINPNVTAGVTYTYNQTDYSNSLTDENRGSDNHSVFASWIQRFSPRLSIRASGGGQIREFENNTGQLAPFVNTSISYIYARRSTLSGGISYTIQNTEVSQFRSADSITLFIRTDNRITTKLTTNLALSGSVQNLQNPIIPTIDDTQERALQFQFGLRYAVKAWLSAGFQFNHTNLNSDIIDRPFNRNRTSLSVTLTY